MIETVPLERAAQAYDRMMKGKAQFRMVLVTTKKFGNWPSTTITGSRASQGASSKELGRRDPFGRGVSHCALRSSISRRMNSIWARTIFSPLSRVASVASPKTPLGEYRGA
jgi:hypothetical protein